MPSPADVEFVGGDSDFRSEAEFAAAGKASAGAPLFARFRNEFFAAELEPFERSVLLSQA